MKHKPLLSEVRQMQKIAGILKEDIGMFEQESDKKVSISTKEIQGKDGQTYNVIVLFQNTRHGLSGQAYALDKPFTFTGTVDEEDGKFMNVKLDPGYEDIMATTFVKNPKDGSHLLGSPQPLGDVYQIHNGFTTFQKQLKEDDTLEPEAGVSDEEEIDLDGDTDTDSWNKPDPDDTDEFEKEPTTRDIKGTKDLTGVLKYQADLKDLVNMKDTILSKYKSGQIGLDQYKQQIGNIPHMIKKLRSQIEKAMNVSVDDEDEAGM